MPFWHADSTTNTFVMTISKATLEDVNAVAYLFNLYRMFYGKESDIDLACSFIHSRLENRDSTIFVARDEAGHAVGFTQLYPTFSSVSATKSWILNDLFVLDSQRGKGIGQALLGAAKALAIETGANGLALETAPDNTGAQRLYESLGYVKDETYFHYFLSV
ncbi:Acetyltransferase, GNAT family [Grimontia indica]|uniref:Acetyltransferase, GNAT family n=2 Tax=Vibrionaceae TaxID=641 RepID=R1GPV5_9GAMM|nr:Acetyltransferase, GNAT family [Grimontia indica]